MNDEFTNTFHLDVFALPPRMNAAELAESTRYMKTTHKLFSYTGFDFFKEPTIAASDLSHVHTVAIQACSQIGKSTALENIIHWIVKYDKSNVLYIADSQKTASKMAKTRFKSFLHEIGIDEIREKELRAGEKSDSTFLMSLGAGATLAVGSSKSASDLASMSARYILGDELARWETLKGEGNPLDLATQRQLQAGRGMRVLVSTPTDENCLITQEYNLGTQEVWGCLCGSCNKHFTVEWNLIDWTGETPTYTCPHCGESWTEKDITGFVHCYSEPHNPEPILDDKGRIYRSFQITGPNCHAIYTWKYLKELERASLARGQDSMQSFTNTRIGLPWTPPTEVRIDASALMRASMLRYTDTTLPLEIEYLCGGIDTHDNALYYCLWGFNRSLSSAYAITSHIIAGDVEKDSQPFSQLTAYLNRTYTREDGVSIRPHFAFIDSGGHKTQAVLLYSQINKRCKPVKGWDSTKRQETPDPLIRREFSMVCERIKSRVPVVEISSGHGKDVFYELAKLTLAGDQRIAASMKACFREPFFRGLCSEVRINGKWLALQGGKTPNEMLDCFVYALSAAHYYKENWALTGRDPEYIAQLKATKHKEKETMNEETMKEEVKEVQEVKDQKEVKVKRTRKKKEEVKEPSKESSSKEEVKEPSKEVKEPSKEAKDSPSPKRKIHKF